MANFALALASIDVQIPMIDTTQMMPVLMGMLGLEPSEPSKRLGKLVESSNDSKAYVKTA